MKFRPFYMVISRVATDPFSEHDFVPEKESLPGKLPNEHSWRVGYYQNGDQLFCVELCVPDSHTKIWDKTLHNIFSRNFLCLSDLNDIHVPAALIQYILGTYEQDTTASFCFENVVPVERYPTLLFLPLAMMVHYYCFCEGDALSQEEDEDGSTLIKRKIQDPFQFFLPLVPSKLGTIPWE